MQAICTMSLVNNFTMTESFKSTTPLGRTAPKHFFVEIWQSTQSCTSYQIKSDSVLEPEANTRKNSTLPFANIKIDMRSLIRTVPAGQNMMVSCSW